MSSISDLVMRVRAASTRPANLGGETLGALSLAVGEPAGTTSLPIVQAAIESLGAGRTRYERLSGSPRLRERLAENLGDRANPAIGAENVVITHGASAGLAATTLALINPGDVVVLPEPTYSLYRDHVVLAGGQVRWVPNGSDGRPQLDLLRSAMSGAKLVVLCNPSNPTGCVLTARELTDVVDLAAEHGASIIVDEAYRDIVFDDRSFASSISFVEDRPHVVCCGTFSKSFAMTGWRLGWVAAETQVAEAINLVHRSINGPLNTFVQDAAVAALGLPQEHLDALVDELQDRREIVCSYLDKVPGTELTIPQGAFYAFPRLDVRLTAAELVSHLAASGVMVRAGSEFGPSGEGHIRISFALDSADLKEGMERLVSALHRLPSSTSRAPDGRA